MLRHGPELSSRYTESSVPGWRWQGGVCQGRTRQPVVVHALGRGIPSWEMQKYYRTTTQRRTDVLVFYSPVPVPDSRGLCDW